MALFYDYIYWLVQNLKHLLINVQDSLVLWLCLVCERILV